MRSRLPRWPAGRADRAVLVALAALLTAGIALRLGLTLARGPALVGNGDSFWYLRSAEESLFADRIRLAGYPLFLRLIHDLHESLSATILLQHTLGVATALLLFLTVRRAASAAWGLIPAAVVLLAGPQLLVEHALLTETVFTFLIAAMFYCAARALGDRPLPWAALAGVLAAVASCTRVLGQVFTLLLLAWLALALPGGLRQRLSVAATTAVCTWLVFAGYIVAEKHENGYVGLGLSQMGGLNLYVRVAGFADCTRFTPPRGTADLCEVRPPSARPGPYWYSLSPESPGLARLQRLTARDSSAVVRFSRAAILHQPDDYLQAIGGELTRYWSSEARYGPEQGEPYRISNDLLVTGDSYFLMPALLRAWYPTRRGWTRQGLLDALRGYERRTRLEGPAFMLLVLLALAGLPFARGRRLRLGLLMSGASVVALVVPVASSFFAARFAVPGYGLLAAAGAIGGSALWERAAATLDRRRPRAPKERAAA